MRLASRDLSSAAIVETVRFLRDPRSREDALALLDDWLVATDALEQAGLTWHAQQIRAILRLLHSYPDYFHDFKEFADTGADALEGAAPRTVWGVLKLGKDGLFYLDSIYSYGYPSLRVATQPIRRLASGEQLSLARTVYMDRRYSGRSHDIFKGEGFVQLHRGAAVRPTRTKQALSALAIADRLTLRQLAILAWRLENWTHPLAYGSRVGYGRTNREREMEKLREDYGKLVKLGLLTPVVEGQYGTGTPLGRKIWHERARQRWADRIDR